MEEQPNAKFYKSMWEAIAPSSSLKEPVDDHIIWEVIQEIKTPDGINLLIPHSMVLIHTASWGSQYVHLHTDPTWTTDKQGYLLASPVITCPRNVQATPVLTSPKWDRQHNMNTISNLAELTVKLLTGRRKYHLKRWNCKHFVKELTLTNENEYNPEDNPDSREIC